MYRASASGVNNIVSSVPKPLLSSCRDRWVSDFPFLDDLADAKLADRVLILGFSEFGRRVEENASAGTDHGAAVPVFLAGPSVKPGLLSTYHSLTDLIDGDLKPIVDFRRVYATILDRWLGLSSKATLGGTFEPLPLLNI
jgi:uncharacterized protein (DUF1501 family)